MIPTVEQVTADVQALLGDDPTLLRYTQAKQFPFFGIAFREMWDLMMSMKLQTVELEALYVLSMNTPTVTPAIMGIVNMGEPTRLWERRPGTEERDFAEMFSEGHLPQIVPAATLRWWKWESDRFSFVPATEDRELKIEYLASGAPPATGPIPVDNSRSFLAARTASLMALPYGMPGLASTLERVALGPAMEPDGTGGLLRKLVNPMIKEKQNRPVVPPRFRLRRAHP